MQVSSTRAGVGRCWPTKRNCDPGQFACALFDTAGDAGPRARVPLFVSSVRVPALCPTDR